MKKTFALICALMTVLLALAAPNLHAQNGKSALAGHVVDGSGAILNGASVELQPTGAIVVTNAQGAYYINNLEPGTYTITVTCTSAGQATQTSTVTLIVT